MCAASDLPKSEVITVVLVIRVGSKDEKIGFCLQHDCRHAEVVPDVDNVRRRNCDVTNTNTFLLQTRAARGTTMHKIAVKHGVYGSEGVDIGQHTASRL